MSPPPISLSRGYKGRQGEVQSSVTCHSPSEEAKVGYVVRVVSDSGKSVNSREYPFDFKNEALQFIGTLGTLSNIRKLPNEGKGRVYTVTPKKK